jgi:hypothetical protein
LEFWFDNLPQHDAVGEGTDFEVCAFFPTHEVKEFVRDFKNEVTIFIFGAGSSE